MKKIGILFLVIAASFLMGFVVKGFIAHNLNSQNIKCNLLTVKY